MTHPSEPTSIRSIPTDEPTASPHGGPAHPGAAFAALEGAPATPESVMTILVYSDDVDTREAVKRAIGRRPAADVPRVAWLECATGPAVIAAFDTGGVDVAILDGEAVPTGGMGIARQAKDEIFECPPIVVLTGRVADGWLANWSRAEAAVPHPLDPIELARTVAELMRRRGAELARS